MKPKAVSLLKRLGGTLMLPLIMYFAMMILCYSNGKMYYGTVRMWRTLIVDIAVSVTCAMGIGLQFRSGRFDFSGGSIMLLGRHHCRQYGRARRQQPAADVRALRGLLLALSMLVALFYVYARVPIIITTIGFALLYESITCLIFDGTGINIISNMTLRVFSTYPMVLIPLLAAVGLYAFYCYFTTSGKKAVLLANNQQAAVNIRHQRAQERAGVLYASAA